MSRRYGSSTPGPAAGARLRRSEIVARVGAVIPGGGRLVLPEGAGLRLILHRHVGHHLRRGIFGPGGANLLWT